MPASPPQTALAGEPGEQTGRTRAVWLVVAATAIFLALGIPQAGRPLHSDEVEFVRLGAALAEKGSHLIDRGFIDDVVETGQMQSWNFHPPLYTWGLGIAFKLFGVSEITARGFGLACGVASLWLVFAIARRAASRSDHRHLVGALAAGLCAVNPFFLQGCLMVDIDGSIYTLIFLLLTYAVFRLEPGSEWVRLAVMTLGFAVALAAKMTTALVFPIVLGCYHVVRGEGRKAVGDGLVVGLGGGVVFLAGYWGYARLVGLNFHELFIHTSRSSSGFGAASLLLRALVFLAPLPLLWGVFPPREGVRPVPRIWSLGAAAGGLALLYAINVLRPELKIWIGWQVYLMSFYLVTVPFCTPLLLGLFYGATAREAGRWFERRFEPLDFVIGLTAAVLIAYIGVFTRGGTFSFYQAPVVPLLAIVAAQVVSKAIVVSRKGVSSSRGEGTPPTLFPAAAEGRTKFWIFGGLAGLAFVYGLLVVGDSYFLIKYRLFEVENREAFAGMVRWWARNHADDPSALRTLGNYLGYQPAGLAAIWYGVVLVPVMVIGVFFARRQGAARPGLAAALGAMAIGSGMSLSARQSAAHYRTNLYYGLELDSTRQMADFINRSVELKGYYLAPRGISYYLRQPGYIDDTRYSGGYRHTTTPEIKPNGELVLRVDETVRAQDALPQAPIHFAIGQYPLLDNQPSYRVLKQFGRLKLYAFTPEAAR